MKILIAPLNWGLGHAARCVPLIDYFLAQGHEVVLGGDGVALQYLQQRYPFLRSIELAPLNLRYSGGKRQVFAMLVAIPKLVLFSIRDHRLLKRIQKQERFDQVISDNRFGLYLTSKLPTLGRNQTATLHSKLAQRASTLNYRCVYLTHQLHIMFPRPYRWLEPLVSRMHACVYNRYNEVWVPDTPDHRLSGELSVPQATGDRRQATDNNSSLHHSAQRFNSSFKYIGPLSRFSSDINLPSPSGEGQGVRLTPYKIVALFSGLEPHRTLFEQAILERYKGHEEEVLLVNGKLDKQLSDSELAYYLTHAEKIIARSGYSTIMDLDALGVIDKAELIPTPGQPEQEYLAHFHSI